VRKRQDSDAFEVGLVWCIRISPVPDDIRIHPGTGNGFPKFVNYQEVELAKRNSRQMLLSNPQQPHIGFKERLVRGRNYFDRAGISIAVLDDRNAATKRMLTQFEGLDDEIRGEQTKVAHLLKIAEERLKETLTEYRSDYEKAWEQHVTLFDLNRKQQRELTDAIAARLEALEQDDAEHEERWHALRETWAEQSKRQLLELERARQELEASVGKRKKRGIQ